MMKKIIKNNKIKPRLFINVMAVLLLFIIVTSCSEQRIDGVRIGTIKGKVVEKGTNTPVGNVKITTNPSSTTEFSDEKGNFILKDVLVDKYTVQAELSGYNEAFESVTVIEDQQVNVAFELSDKDALNKPPSSPNLAFPEDKSVEVPLEVTFQWQSRDPDPKDELTYKLEIRNGDTNEIELFETGKDTFYVYKDLKLATKYFWEVKVTDKINDEVSSSISEFTTLKLPNNPIVLVKQEDGNSVIYSGKENLSQTDDDAGPDKDLLRLTPVSANSFRPRASKILKKIAFLKSVGGDTHIFTMNPDGSEVKKVTDRKPINGFRLDEVDYCWAAKSSKIYYPNFDELYSVNSDGSGRKLIYKTPDNSFISEVEAFQYDSNLVVLKTNEPDGYNVRIVILNLLTGTEQEVIAENIKGAFGGIDISAKGDKIVYTHDVSNFENSDYRILESRVFIYDVVTKKSEPVETDTPVGTNILDPKYLPSEGGLIFTKVKNNLGATPEIVKFIFDGNSEDKLLFTNASMPDWD